MVFEGQCFRPHLVYTTPPGGFPGGPGGPCGPGTPGSPRSPNNKSNDELSLHKRNSGTAPERYFGNVILW